MHVFFEYLLLLGEYCIVLYILSRGWWLGIVVTRFIRSTKLLYAGLG